MIYFKIGINENAIANTHNALSLQLVGATPQTSSILLGAQPPDGTAHIAPLAPTTNYWIRRWYAVGFSRY